MRGATKMKRTGELINLGLALVLLNSFPVLAADAPASSPPPAESQSPQVPPAAAGVFAMQKRGPNSFHLSVTGHSFTSREAIEQYLAYRAAELAKAEHFDWFTIVEHHAKGDKVLAPKADPDGPRFSFRMAYWRPVWRYKLGSDPAWKSWNPFSGSAFFATEPKAITTYEVSADIVLHKAPMTGIEPLAFDADALSDFLVNQVAPPQ
jgi:hypothetical protein